MSRLHRKIIHIQAEDSPNVRRGFVEQERGLEPTGVTILPGVLGYFEYLRKEATWDDIKKTISLRGQFWEGSDTLLYPPHWLDRAERIHRELVLKKIHRVPIAMGVDSGQGKANTCWSLIDRLGLWKLISRKTGDTTKIVDHTIWLINNHHIPPESVLFDKGGGGLEHAQRCRRMGYDVGCLGFGESAYVPPIVGRKQQEDKEREKEERFAYVDVRTQMYHQLSELLDPDNSEEGFALPLEIYPQLRHQMAPIPRLYDEKGRMRIPPKHAKRKQGQDQEKADKESDTLVKLIGYSPDELDSLVLAVHIMIHSDEQTMAGAI